MKSAHVIDKDDKQEEAISVVARIRPLQSREMEVRQGEDLFAENFPHYTLKSSCHRALHLQGGERNVLGHTPHSVTHDTAIQKRNFAFGENLTRLPLGLCPVPELTQPAYFRPRV